MGLSWAEINKIWGFHPGKGRVLPVLPLVTAFSSFIVEIISACPSVGSAQTPGGGGHSVYGVYLGGGICVGV